LGERQQPERGDVDAGLVRGRGHDVVLVARAEPSEATERVTAAGRALAETARQGKPVQLASVHGSRHDRPEHPRADGARFDWNSFRFGPDAEHLSGVRTWANGPSLVSELVTFDLSHPGNEAVRPVAASPSPSLRGFTAGCPLLVDLEAGARRSCDSCEGPHFAADPYSAVMSAEPTAGFAARVAAAIFAGEAMILLMVALLYRSDLGDGRLVQPPLLLHVW